MANVETQSRRFLSGGCWFLSLMLAVGQLCMLRDYTGACDAAAGQNFARCDWDETVKNELRAPLVLDGVFGDILVCIEVNGKTAKVILDTGSDVTILSPEMAPQTHTEPSYPVTPQKGSGYVSTGQWGTANLHLGDRYWINRRILVDEMRSISQAHKQRIDGILGRDILKQFRFVTIDYERRLLTLGSQ